MQLTPPLAPSDPALLSAVFPGTGSSPSRAGAPVAEGRATASGTFGELFPELGATPTAPATALRAPAITLPLATAALATPSTPLPASVALTTTKTTPLPAPAPCAACAPSAPSAPESASIAAVVVVNDKPSVQSAQIEVSGPEPHDYPAERRSQMPASRRLSEKHRELAPPAGSPAADELTRDERALAAAVAPVNLAQPAISTLEPIAAHPTAEWGSEDAAPVPAKETPLVSDDRPLPLFSRTTPAREAETPPGFAAASVARTRGFPTLGPTPELKPVSQPFPTAASEVPLAPHRDAPGTLPREKGPERMPVVRPAPAAGAGAHYVSPFPEAGFRSMPNGIPTPTERAAFPQTPPEESMRQPEMIPAVVKSVPPAPVALAAATKPASSDDRVAQTEPVEFVEERAARLLGGEPVAPATPRPLHLAAKFAPAALRDGVTPIAARNVAVKTFVNAGPESLTRHRLELGIGVAKSSATMPERLMPALPPHPMPEYGMVAPALEGRFELEAASAATPSRESAPAEAVSSAQRAVEVALRAVDAAAAGAQKTVSLDFAVGDADLNVRIEIRADEVRTTFRTDSAELRTALAQEWQVIATNPAADRALRLAPATFASAEAPALNASGGDASSRERHAQTQQSENPPAAFTSAGRARAAASVHSVSVPTAIRSLIAAATSRHLHTLA